MKNTLAVLSFTSVLLAASVFAAEEGGDYTLTIDGKTYDISLGEQITVPVNGGKTLPVKLSLKDVLTYRTERFSFQHENGLRPSRSEINEDLVQTLLMTPLGSGVIIQEYADIDQDLLVTELIKALTGDEVAAGYKMKTSNASRTAANEVVLKGRVAVTTKDDEQWTRGVFWARQSAGILVVVTMMETSQTATGKPVIDRFWSTLNVAD